MNENTLKNRKKLIAFLIMLSLVLTTGTFAYWASNVEGTSEDAVGTLNVGSAGTVTTKFDLSNELNSGGCLVPSNQAINSQKHAVEAIELHYDLAWQEDSSETQVTGTTSVGQVSVSHHVLVFIDEEVLDQELYSNIYKLINVDYSEINPTEMTLDGDTETFNFTVTMDEPTNQIDYNIIAGANISILFQFSIEENLIDTTDIDNNEPEIIVPDGPYLLLNGEEVVYIEISEEYEDEGVTLYDSEGNIGEIVWLNNYPDTWTVGEYVISYFGYSTLDNEFVSGITRTVIVVDTTAPEITINGEEYVSLELGTEYQEWGAFAIDNSGLQVTVEISGQEDVDCNTAGTYYVTYRSIDNSGNETIAIRTIIVK